jgi:hypothetical protein
MRKCLFAIGATLVSMLPSFALAQGRNEAQRDPKQVALWAGISVGQPILSEGAVERLQISFGVVNDGSTTVDPRIGASQLSINGVEPKDWVYVINNGIRTAEFQALPPGHFLSFSYGLGRYFAKPGVYTVRWWGQNFRAQPITLRVLPKK